jgi:hypothetical protein
MAAARAVNSNNQCLKVFVQRDYSEGTLVKFQTRFPTELEDRVGSSRGSFEIKSATIVLFQFFIAVSESLMFLSLVKIEYFFCTLECVCVFLS